MKEITYSGIYFKKNLFQTFFKKLHKLGSFPIGYLRKRLKINVWSIDGTHSGENKLKLLFMGNPTDQQFFSNLIFKNHARVDFVGNKWLWGAAGHLFKHRHQYDMIICQSRRKICNLLSSKKRLIIPDWVSCEIDLCRGVEGNKFHKKNMKQNIKRFMKNGYTYTISKDPKDFELFYHKMYKPYVSTRHRNDLVFISYDTIKNNFENGELILVMDGEKAIAGGIINYSMMKGIPRGTQLGVYNGDYEYVKKGALAAYYYYTMEYLKEKNYALFSLGGTRPFYNNGVLKHKLSWGAKIVGESSNAFLFCLTSGKRSLKKFLADNPFVCIDRNQLALAVYDEENSATRGCCHLSKEKMQSTGIDHINRIRI